MLYAVCINGKKFLGDFDEIYLFPSKIARETVNIYKDCFSAVELMTPDQVIEHINKKKKKLTLQKFTIKKSLAMFDYYI
jgi:hypothetical protein